MFRLINDQPTVHEVVTGKRLSKDKPSADSGPKSKPSTKSAYRIANPKEIQRERRVMNMMMMKMKMKMKMRVETMKAMLFVGAVGRITTRKGSGLGAIYVRDGSMASV
nr:PHD finger protein ALFIN-LIKE 2-like [Ipomoea batatas]